MGVSMPIDTATMPTVMFEFNPIGGKPPELESFKQHFGLQGHEVDETYGFVEMQVAKSFMTIITKEAGERILAEKRPNVVGVFSNPQAAPLGAGTGAAGGSGGGFGTFGMS